MKLFNLPVKSSAGYKFGTFTNSQKLKIKHKMLKNGFDAKDLKKLRILNTAQTSSRKARRLSLVNPFTTTAKGSPGRTLHSHTQSTKFSSSGNKFFIRKQRRSYLMPRRSQGIPSIEMTSFPVRHFNVYSMTDSKDTNTK